MSQCSDGQAAGPLQQKLEEILTKVRAMAPGGDLEGLLEEGAAEFKMLLYEAATRQRRESRAAAPADFPPSGLSAVRAPDAGDRGQAAPGADAGRSTAL